LVVLVRTAWPKHTVAPHALVRQREPWWQRVFAWRAAGPTVSPRRARWPSATRWVRVARPGPFFPFTKSSPLF
jgi:hypothetical protein